LAAVEDQALEQGWISGGDLTAGAAPRHVRHQREDRKVVVAVER
jgi:hypothetical protein